MKRGCNRFYLVAHHQHSNSDVINTRSGVQRGTVRPYSQDLSELQVIVIVIVIVWGRVRVRVRVIVWVRIRVRVRDGGLVRKTVEQFDSYMARIRDS